MRVLVLGANSDIGFAVAAKFAECQKAEIILASRNKALLDKKANDLAVRYQVKAEAIIFDATVFDTHKEFVDRLNPLPDITVVAFGFYCDQTDAENDFELAKRLIDSNYTGAASVLEIMAPLYEEKGAGAIIGISSVAGDRGRGSNYLYGSAKAAFTTYLAGLRNRLFKKGITVITVLPGFTRTKMTEGLDLPEPLVAEPEEVADDIYRAWQKKKSIIYTKWYWRFIMMIIRNIPEFLFKRMGL